MPTRNVNLSNELDDFVLAEVDSGRFENASEVVRAALRAFDREGKEYDARLEALRAAIDAEKASGVAKLGSFSRVRKAIRSHGSPNG